MTFRELNVHPRILSALEKVPEEILEFSSVLSITCSELKKITQLSSTDVEILRQAVAKVVVSRMPVSVLEITQNPELLGRLDKKLSIGCPILDKFLRGGILTRRVTEIAGESGSGKTQICLQLCLNVQLPEELGGLDSGAAFICTEDVFPSARLQQLIGSFEQKYGNGKFSDHIYIHHVADMDALKSCLTQQLPLLMNRRRIRFLVLDSIAAIFRTDYDSREIFARSADLHWIGRTLHRMCWEHDLTVLCTNQVSAVIRNHARQTDPQNVPSLGLAWSNLISSRLMLSRTSQTLPLDGPSPLTSVKTCATAVRQLEVTFAPHLPKSSCRFVVVHEGVRGLEK